MNFFALAFAWYETHQVEIAAAGVALKNLQPAVANAVKLVHDLSKPKV